MNKKSIYQMIICSTYIKKQNLQSISHCKYNNFFSFNFFDNAFDGLGNKLSCRVVSSQSDILLLTDIFSNGRYLFNFAIQFVKFKITFHIITNMILVILVNCPMPYYSMKTIRKGFIKNKNVISKKSLIFIFTKLTKIRRIG